MDPFASPLPLFPLQTVLFPGGVLPLKIFEVRYLDLIGRCHREGTPFGIVTLSQGQEVRTAQSADEVFFDVGTLATVTRFERPQPGLLQIECLGGQRFRVKASQRLGHGLWVATEAEPLPDDPPAHIPDEQMHLVRMLEQVARGMKSAEGRGMDELWQPPHRWDDAGWVANRWCELLPVKVELRQRCMALNHPVLRLELVDDMLERLGVRLPGAAPQAGDQG
jgi:Lon protease-like protein